ncbi:hypothetical protein FRB99_003773 [Tulasnella sp. 403]|nr:hypothetical protein FRB99_003773 [Tulasnella sp. 403]
MSADTSKSTRPVRSARLKKEPQRTGDLPFPEGMPDPTKLLECLLLLLNRGNYKTNQLACVDDFVIRVMFEAKGRGNGAARIWKDIVQDGQVCKVLEKEDCDLFTKTLVRYSLVHHSESPVRLGTVYFSGQDKPDKALVASKPIIEGTSIQLARDTSRLAKVVDYISPKRKARAYPAAQPAVQPVAMAATSTKIPPHEVHDLEGQPTTSIDIEGWTISSTSMPISNSGEIDQLQESLNGLPMPEMPFGNNSIVLRHHASGWEYRFDAAGALAGVKLGELGEGDGGVKVGYAREWMQSRLDPASETPMPETSPTTPYDWTYTTTYPGHTTNNSAPNLKFVPADPENESHCIPLAQLARRDPILYYSEVPLYEDELHDNGSSRLVVRLRVMPTCFFILSRLTVRVDNVVFRTFDTRIYHSFTSDPQSLSGTPHVVRETSGWEAPYDLVKKASRIPYVLCEGENLTIRRIAASAQPK